MASFGATWRTSTRSGTQGQCVEVRYLDGRIEVRDSKDREGTSLALSTAAWTKFVASLGNNRQDRV
ncbi:DUF397 domain-containing protein [Micromonospora sp. WMMD1128]|uniref:DUF397 domain-containing protein n=1 Tax=unclassified Micromonospora TaxID=2617518 RepID=UPI00248BC62C|nr:MULTISPECIES: DUF397 domain-containing protein [unclassified Micromonospora]WBB77152.1 DUF397 domain-containing protein [Micromonospora sp. WMMD1128]WFE33806.1 DUF397 domain-containing protein [Micromonospora sp. WMMD975]